MEAVDDFSGALAEVDLLMVLARGGPHADETRTVLVKASLLLLAAKLECFFEAIIEEYCDLECEKESALHVPSALRISAARKLLMESKVHETEAYNLAMATSAFESIADLWSDTRPCPKLKIDTKFGFGKHGEGQVVRLFKRIGIDDIFEAAQIDDNTESFASTAGSQSVAPDFNSLINLRNNIIHTDATPAMTEEDIERYKRRFLLFVRKVEDLLIKTVNGAAGIRAVAAGAGPANTVK